MTPAVTASREKHPWPVAPQCATRAVDPIVLQIVEGTNQIQRNIIGNALLGRAPRR